MIALSNQDKVLTLRERIERCASWPELLAVTFPEAGMEQDSRNVGLRSDFYEDPVTCRLYDVLHSGDRAAYLSKVVQQLKTVVIGLPEGATVTEMGCGPGHILFGLAADPDVAAKEIKFVGYDPSSEMIAIAHERLRSAG